MSAFTGTETLILLLHGESGVGKSPIAATGPKPLLLFDVENRARFIKGKKVYWDPMREEPPAAGDWEICVVKGTSFTTMEQMYRWLNSGQHCFRTVDIDSLTELQKRARDGIFEEGVGAGNGDNDDMNQRRWGILLQRMEKVIRDLRDLVVHPTNPLQCIVFTTLVDDKKGRIRPFVQGSLAISLPGFVDVIGYVYTEPTETGAVGITERRMLVQPSGVFVAKDSTSELPSGGITGVYGSVVKGPINVAELIDRIYGI